MRIEQQKTRNESGLNFFEGFARCRLRLLRTVCTYQFSTNINSFDKVACQS